MKRKLLCILLTVMLVLCGSIAAFAATPGDSSEAAAKAAAMQAEARAEIEARGEEYQPVPDDTETKDDKAAAMQEEVLAEQRLREDSSIIAEKNPDVERRRLELEKKYGISIRYDLNADGTASIGTGCLSALDMALETFTPSAVRQLSEYWRGRNGSKLCYSFVYSPYQRMGLGVDVLGSFDPDHSLIEIYLPAYGKNVVMGGESPLTYLHELGHAYHYMLMDDYGEAKLKREWNSLNGGESYSFGQLESEFDNTVWISAYASTRYEEDFAEVFAHTFLRVRPGQGFSHLLTNDQGNRTALGKKVRYLETLIPLCFTDTDRILANFARVRTTPTVLNYKGYQFSGEYLQFSGCAYPRFVLTSLLGEMGVEADSSVWVTEIGGWEVMTTKGTRIVVFPGGAWSTLQRSVA